jgi:hypothetical protein
LQKPKNKNQQQFHQGDLGEWLFQVKLKKQVRNSENYAIYEKSSRRLRNASLTMQKQFQKVEFGV